MVDPLGRATRFLLKARHGSWWQDFRTMAGYGKEWVTAYVGASLALMPDESAQAGAQHAWRMLDRSLRAAPGWGFNRLVPADADSTTWALILHRRLGTPRSRRAARAHRLLDRHTDGEGGVRTYGHSRAIRRFTRLTREHDFGGWCTAHVCVTAATALLQAGTPHDFLRGRQRQDGSWDAYWWTEPAYATALAAEALWSGRPGGGAALRTRRWAEARTGEVDAGRDAFAAALLLRTLAATGGRTDRLARELEEVQMPDGSWSPSARLRIPPPHVKEPSTWDRWGSHGGGGSIVRDHGVFTTATVLEALVRHGGTR